MGCGKGDVQGGTKHSKGCVCEVLRAILDIQNVEAEEECTDCPTNCFLEPLGGLTSPSQRRPIDTRVFMLLTKNGDPFKAFYRDTDCPDTDCYSVYFRVEEIFGNCCATLRVLEPLTKGGAEVNLLDTTKTTLNLQNICSVKRFRKTDSCITVDLSCFCGVQCIDDVFLDIC